MRPADELRDAVEAYLGSLSFAPELGGLDEALRYSLESGGKRVRPVLCLAVAEANGGSRRRRAARRRGARARPHVLARPRRPACAGRRRRAPRDGRARTSRSARASRFSPATRCSRRRSGSRSRTTRTRSPASSSDATLGMIGGQYRDITGDDADLEELHRLKTGRLFVAAVRMGLEVAGVGDRRASALARVRRRARAPLPGRGRPPRRRRLRRASRATRRRAGSRIESPSARARSSTSWTPTRACSAELVDALAVRTS